MRGLSLVELLVVMVVAAMLASFSVPSVQSFVTVRAVSVCAGELASTLRLARSEAMKRGSVVSVCAAAASTGSNLACSHSSDWVNGWLIFTDSNIDGVLNAPSGDQVLAAPVLKTGVKSLNASDSTGAPRAFTSFYPNGTVATGAVTFTVEPNISSSHSSYSAAHRRVEQNLLGRVQVLAGL